MLICCVVLICVVVFVVLLCVDVCGFVVMSFGFDLVCFGWLCCVLFVLLCCGVLCCIVM